MAPDLGRVRTRQGHARSLRLQPAALLAKLTARPSGVLRRDAATPDGAEHPRVRRAHELLARRPAGGREPRSR